IAPAEPEASTPVIELHGVEAHFKQGLSFHGGIGDEWLTDLNDPTGSGLEVRNPRSDSDPSSQFQIAHAFPPWTSMAGGYGRSSNSRYRPNWKRPVSTFGNSTTYS